MTKEDAREGREDAGNDFGGNLDEDFWREKILELILKLVPYSST
jgi:hypothetical protein